MNTKPPPNRYRILARRVVFGALVLATTAAGVGGMLSLLQKNGTSTVEWLMLGLFVVLFAQLAFSFWSSMLGFLVLLGRGDPLSVHRRRPAADGSAPRPRVAVVMPIYNEDPDRVMAGLLATYQSLRRTGQLEGFDFHVLSDTTDPDVWVTEELAFARLRGELPDPERFYYRKRPKNTERKAGNIAEFCEQWGDVYRYMIVFDADSVMSGESLVELVELMEAHPDAGIIQAPPVPVNRRTLFGRLQQFAARVHGPIHTAGASFWQAGDGNYFGHNAIIRIQPFIEHCRLPTLSGREPLGGSILSHDFVEAAWMRRAGWKVYMAPDLAGSYEEPPPTLIDYAIRDRRWCQGNLQHARLLGTAGLNRVSRLHLFLGVLSYVSSPLWIVMLLLGTCEGLRQHLTEHTYFPEAGALFPVWRVSIESQATTLFAVVMAMIFLPKLASLILRLRDREEAAAFGGRGRLALGVAFESLFSMLLAPILAIMQTRFVVGVLLGVDVGWGTQRRGDSGTSLAEALRRHGGTTVLGVFWGALVARYAPDLFWWMSPVLAGMVFSIPLSLLSSRIGVGRELRRRGLLVIPEELDPPFVLRRLHTEIARWSAGDPRNGEPAGDGLSRVLADPEVRQVHLSLMPPAASEPGSDPLLRHRLDGLLLKLKHVGLDALSRDERRDLLLSKDAILTLGASAQLAD